MRVSNQITLQFYLLQYSAQYCVGRSKDQCPKKTFVDLDNGAVDGACRNSVAPFPLTPVGLNWDVRTLSLNYAVFTWEDMESLPMKPEMLDVCLRDATNSTEAFRTLYQLVKANRPSCSLAFLCKKSGITSTGYLSDVFKGRRILNQKHFAGLCKAFGLTANASICLRLLLEIDHEKDCNKQESLKHQLVIARKSLNVSYHPFEGSTRELFDALEVFCAFGMFQNSVTRAQLHALFSKTRSSQSIDSSLHYLQNLGLVKNESSLVVTQEHVIFQQMAGGIAPTDFIRLALAHAMANVEQWFPSPQSAFFTSTVLSVDKRNFECLLREFKAYTLSIQASMESQHADTLVRFNVQVYPMGEK